MKTLLKAYTHHCLPLKSEGREVSTVAADPAGARIWALYYIYK